MRKIAMSVVALIILIYGILPYFMGMMAKSSLEKMTTSMGTLNLGLPIKYTLKDYKLGWHDSSAEYIVTLATSQLDEEYQKLVDKLGGDDKTDTTLLTVDEHIQHGPVIFGHSIEGELNWDVGRGLVTSTYTFAPAIVKLLGITPVINSTTLISFGGIFKTDLKIAPITYNNAANNISIKWDGFRGLLEHNANFTYLKQSWDLLPLTAQTPDIKLTTAAIHTEGKAELSQLYKLWVGTGKIEIPALTLKADGADIACQGLHIGTLQDLEGAFADNTIDIKFDKIVVNTKSYGPGEVDFSLKNADAEALGKIQQDIQAINEQPGLTQSERSTKALMILPQMVTIISKGAEFDLNKFELTTAEGQVSMQANLTLTKIDSTKNTFESFKELYKTAKASIDVKMPAALVTKLMSNKLIGQNDPTAAATTTPATTPADANAAAQQKIDQWKASGMLVQDGTNYKFSASFDSGNIIVNGKPMPTPSFSFP